MDVSILSKTLSEQNNDEIDWEIFEDKGIDIWEVGPKYEMRRILISNKRLPELPPKQKRIK